MARVTIEDSLTYVDNRFDLILLASKRARDLMMTGAEARVNDAERDKPTVTALREIAAGKLGKTYFDEKVQAKQLFETPIETKTTETTVTDPDAALIAALSAIDESSAVDNKDSTQ